MSRQPTPAFAARPVPPVPPVPQATEPPTPEQVDDLEKGFAALQRGDFEGTMRAWAQFLHTRPHHEMADRLRDGLDAASRLRSLVEEHYGD
jgi:hypothetical protein